MADWIDSGEGCEVAEDGDRAVVDCHAVRAALTIVETPTSTTLAVRVQESVEIYIEAGVQIGEDFCVEVVVVGTNRGHVAISGPIRRVSCAEPDNGHPYGSHTLVLDHSADVEIADGNWSIDSDSTDEAVLVDLSVTNERRKLSISSSMPVSCLRHRGNHDYGLRLTPDALITVLSGNAMFHDSVGDCRVTGTGNVRVDGDLAESTVRLTGGLHVMGALSGCDLGIQGVLEVDGPLSLGDRDLLCTSVTLRGEAEVNGEFVCDDLTADDAISGTGVFKLGSIRCRGSFTARSISTEADLDIRGSVQCDSVEGRGNIMMRRIESIGSSLAWRPQNEDAHCRLTGVSPEGTSARLRIPRLDISNSPQVDPAPRLDLGAGVEISELRVDVPAVTVVARQTSKDASGDAEVVTGLDLRREDSVIRVVNGSIHFAVLQGSATDPVFAVEQQASLTLAKCSDTVANLRLSGEGDVSIVDSRADAEMRHVDVEGPMRIRSEINIDRLTCRQALSSGASSPALADSVPRLDLASDVQVRRASGPCVLLNIDAKIHGDTSHSQGASDGFAVVAIEPRVDPQHPGTDGQLKNVDIRELSSVDLDKLAKLQVLEIASDSVKKLASERTRLRCSLSRRFRARADLAGALGPADISRRAETVAKYAKLVDERVNSGASRARLHWAIAHLQFRSLRPRSAEWWFRAGYRCLGYGYRPLPALASWIAMALLVLLYALACSDDIAQGGSMIGTFVEVLFMPIGYLRLGSNENAFSLQSGSLDIVARLLIGAPFLFLILSIRQYFKSPVT